MADRELEQAMIMGLNLAVGARVGNLFNTFASPSEQKLDPKGALERYTEGITRTVHHYYAALEVIKQEQEQS